MKFSRKDSHLLTLQGWANGKANSVFTYILYIQANVATFVLSTITILKKNYILSVHSYQIKQASCKLGEKNDQIAKLREEVIYRFDYSFVLKKF